MALGQLLNSLDAGQLSVSQDGTAQGSQDGLKLLVNQLVANQADQQFQQATSDLLAKYAPQPPMQAAVNPNPLDIKAVQKQIADAETQKAIAEAAKAKEQKSAMKKATAARIKADSAIGDPQLNLDASRFSSWLLS